MYNILEYNKNSVRQKLRTGEDYNCIGLKHCMYRQNNNLNIIYKYDDIFIIIIIIIQ